VKYLFDTNIVIGFLKNEKEIVEKTGSLEALTLPIITVGEMLYGAYYSKNSETNISYYRSFFDCCNILHVNDTTAQHYAEIKSILRKTGKLIPENDIWIAAIARENDLIIVTRDRHLIEIDFIKTEEW
jgi:tRNA(fMet)-specific endonuclease VapC